MAGYDCPEYRDNFASSEWIFAMSPQAMTNCKRQPATSNNKKQEDDIIINGTTVWCYWESAVNGENG